MKTIFAVVALAALAGCATQQPYYTQVQGSADPYQWHTVAVAPSGSASRAPSGTWTEELPPAPAYTTSYAAQPVYYAPAPVYYAPAYAPSYYPPVSIGLDFVFSNRGCCGWGGRGWGGRGYHRR